MKIGDLVYLKSGGPAMTVVELSSNPHQPPTALCVWQGGQQWFPLVALETNGPPPRPEVVTEHDWGEWPPKLTDKLPGDLP